MMPARMLIAGASIAGLTTALALSRLGQAVDILERDAPPPPVTSPDHLFTTWNRPGVPHLRHSHGFLARMRNMVRDLYPDLHAALLQAGAQERTFKASLPPVLAPAYMPHPDDDDLTTLICRRTTFERVLYDYVSQQSGICLHPQQRITGLLAEPHGSATHLQGLTVQTQSGHAEWMAETIIDATGRRSPFPGWLRALGVSVSEEVHATGILYYTRFYRLHDGVDEPTRTSHSSLGDLGYLKFGVFPADHQTFSLTLAVPAVEADLRILRHNDAFTKACQALPALANWIDPDRSVPTTDVFSMGGLSNVYRRFVSDKPPELLGYFAVGESAMHTNPLYGRGCSLSFIHAHLLAEVLCQTGLPSDRARKFDARTETELRPFYDVAVKRDQAGLERARLGMKPDQPQPKWKRLMRSLVQHGLGPAIRGHLGIRRAFVRDFNMLAPPGVTLRRVSVVLPILRFWLQGKKRNAHLYAPPSGPARDEMRQRLNLPATDGPSHL